MVKVDFQYQYLLIEIQAQRSRLVQSEEGALTTNHQAKCSSPEERCVRHWLSLLKNQSKLPHLVRANHVGLLAHDRFLSSARLTDANHLATVGGGDANFTMGDMRSQGNPFRTPPCD